LHGKILFAPQNLCSSHDPDGGYGLSTTSWRGPVTTGLKIALLSHHQVKKILVGRLPAASGTPDCSGWLPNDHSPELQKQIKNNGYLEQFVGVSVGDVTE